MKHTLIGRNERFLIAVEKAGQAAKSDYPVLIVGETGVGKNALAEYIRESDRRDRPFIHINWKTMENAWFENTGDNEQYRWRRDQEWYFDNPPTPIPGNYCYITLNRPGETYSLNGLWTGVEIKERIGNRVKLQTNWLRWECDFINGFYYRCPYQRQYDGWDEDELYYDCEAGHHVDSVSDDGGWGEES